jgi:hypothetical protein
MIAGTIASIGSAIWAFYQAKKATQSASKAEQVRDEIIDRRKMVEISQVHLETSRILKTVSTVGPSCNASQLRGVNCASIAREVEEYSRFINEQSSHFSALLQEKSEALCSGLNGDIEALSEAKTFEEKKAAGKSIYYKINSFMPVVKELVDEKKESSVHLIN